MRNNKKTLAVVISSTREGRFAPTVAKWFVGWARRDEELEVDVIDLAEISLPAVYPQEFSASAKAYAKRIDAADAFVVVVPEYNHGYPASLKQAIDFAHSEWNAKPVGFVSYGGRSGGIRAVEQLRQVFAELHCVTVRSGVSLHNAWQCFDDDGAPCEPDGIEEAARVMLDEIKWWADAVSAARQIRPFPA